MILAPTLSASAGSGAAIVRPTFSRDFAGEKTLNNGTGPAITFTRNSVGTYFDQNGTLQTASNDVPRFDHDPATGASLGLVIEEARTNSIVQSEDLSTTWLNTGITVTTNQTTAPDGTSNADLLETTLVNEAHSLANTQTWAAGTYTFSVFAKHKDHQWITLRMGFGGDAKFATFDIQNAVTGTATAGVTRSITSVGGGWYRLVMTATLATAGTQGVLIILNDADDLNNTAYTGTGTGAYIWGAQLEAGAFPTSYIPTTTAAVTRQADQAYVTPISSFFNASEGTLFVEESPLYASGEKNTDVGLVSIAGDTSNFINIRSFGQCAVAAGGSTQGTLATGGAANRNTRTRRIFAFKQDDLAATGSLATSVATDTSAALPTGLTELRLARAGSREPTLSNHFSKVAYWPKRLSNALLQQLST